MDEYNLQEQIVAFVRAFGLHKGEETPCGKSLSVAEAYVLMELERDGQLAQNVLVERLNLAKSTVSRLVQQMRKRGWIERQRSPEDGRVWLWQLTPAGRTLAADVAQARQEKFVQIMAQIPAEARQSVSDSLNILVEAIRGNHTD